MCNKNKKWKRLKIQHFLKFEGFEPSEIISNNFSILITLEIKH